MRSFRQLFKITSMLLILLLCAGCGASPDASADSFQLDMTATLIRPYESASTTLTISGTYPEAGTEGEILNQPIEMKMVLGGGIDHTFGVVSSPYYYSVLPESGTGNILHIVTNIYDPETNAPTSGIVGLDLENECFIFLFDAYPDQYIVASTDESRTPEEILEHFAAFIEYCEE